MSPIVTLSVHVLFYLQQPAFYTCCCVCVPSATTQGRWTSSHRSISRFSYVKVDAGRPVGNMSLHRRRAVAKTNAEKEHRIIKHP